MVVVLITGNVERQYEAEALVVAAVSVGWPLVICYRDGDGELLVRSLLLLLLLQ